MSGAFISLLVSQSYAQFPEILEHSTTINSHDEVGYMTFKYGLTTITDDLSLDQNSFAVDFIGDIGHQIKPKLDFSYVSIDDSDSVDYLLQTSLNAFYKSEYGYQNIIPYMYIGLGYEYVGGARENFDSSVYMQEGLGIEIPISQPSDDLHIITEIRLMQMIGSGKGQDSEAALFIGLRLPIGKTFSSYDRGAFPMVTQSEYPDLNPTVSGQNIVDTYKASIASNENINQNSQYNIAVDGDGDGVVDSMDICPNTPFETAVNKVGCPIRDDIIHIEKPRVVAPKVPRGSAPFRALPTLRKVLDVRFELNSDKIVQASRETIKKFVEAVNHTSSNITIKGYTDNTGLYENNMALSQRRAEAVKTLMVQYGVASNRIKAIGKGPLNPIASNDTEIGRAQNRRIEIIVE